MLPSLRLGLTLSLRATDHGRFRALSALLTSLMGCALLVVVLSLLDAGRPRSLAPGIAASDVFELILPGIVALAIGLPVLAAAAATGRMSEQDRSRRMARLHLLGMRRRDQVLIGVGESLPPALIGAVGGMAVGALLVPWAGKMLLEMTPSPSVAPAAVIVAFAVPLCLVAGAATSARRTHGEDLERARGEVARRPGLWRAAILVIGLVMLMLSWSLPRLSNAPLVVLFIGGAGLAALGSLLLPALLVRRSADVLVRAGTPVTVVAGRRLQSQPAVLGRVLGALVIGVVVTTAAQGLVSVLSATPIYQAGRHYREVEAVAETRVPDQASVAELEDAVERVGGAREVIYNARGLVVAAGSSPGEFSFWALVSTCEELRILRPEVGQCRDDRAAWIPASRDLDLGTPPRGTVDLFSGEYDETTGGYGEPVLQLDVSEKDLARVPGVPAWQETDPAPTLFVPRALVTQEQFWQFGQLEATITADPRPDLPAELNAEGIDAHIGWTAEDFAPYHATIDTIRLLNLVVLAVGLGAFLLGTADLAIGRRQEHARLRLLGTPVGALRRAHWLEVALPLVVGGGAALAIGHLVAVAFVETGNRGMDPGLTTHLGLSSLTGPMLAVVGGSVVIAAITSLGIGAPLRPDHIRRA
ncbi:FtsX-like permease family protein [Brachybacterium tyrofermentans]|uniref:FtsX-like permease family protein n=1 Tax=Brachybacterium tyrofermentans TaxID=47848 RepID=A0ABW0FAF2_9MICO|nr:FtsX-like permease family protein [Brachybacterium tyrofermentans]